MWNIQGFTVAIGIVGMVLMGCGMSVEEKEADAVATPRMTASDLPWWDMSAEDYRGSNEKINQWATESLGYDPGYSYQSRVAGLCLPDMGTDRL